MWCDKIVMKVYMYRRKMYVYVWAGTLEWRQWRQHRLHLRVSYLIHTYMHTYIQEALIWVNSRLDPNNYLTWDGHRIHGCLCDKRFCGWEIIAVDTCLLYTYIHTYIHTYISHLYMHIGKTIHSIHTCTSHTYTYIYIHVKMDPSGTIAL